MRSGPKVSVMMPAFNTGPYVDEAVQSVVAQTFQDWEVVAVDDCSRDDTYQRLMAWAEREPRVRAFRNERNLGMTRNWNACLARSGGELVMKLDADDQLRPRTLQLMVEALEDVDVRGCGVRTLLCTETLEPFAALPADDAMANAGINPFRDQVLSCDEWMAFAVFGHQPWSSCAIMLRRELLGLVGGFDERFGCASDTDLIWRVLGGGGRFAHRAYVGVHYRQLEGSVSHQYRRDGWLRWEALVANLLAFQRYRRSRGLPRRARQRYVELWRRWEAFRRSADYGKILGADLGRRLTDASASLEPPPMADTFTWQARRWASRLPI